MTAVDGRRSRDGLVVLIPIYNDWHALRLLLDDLDAVLAAAGRSAAVLVVDDGSTSPAGDDWTPALRAIDRVDILTLRRNLGHQRAIAIGLAHIHDHHAAATVVVMDGDGEDAPRDVPRLLEDLDRNDGRRIVFAERTRRSEGLVFSLFYAFYRAMHVALTGIPVRVGNFSAIPGRYIERIVVVSELWNHYAAAVFKARLPRSAVPTTRANRLSGESRMNFVSLVGHGLSALSVHAETIGVRLLVAAFAIAVLVVSLLASVVGIRLLTDLAIPGWATAAAGLLVLLLCQVVAFAVLFVFLVLHARSQPLFIPIRDYAYFVSGVRTISTMTGAKTTDERTRAVT